MARSVKKGAFIDGHLLKAITGMNTRNERKVHTTWSRRSTVYHEKVLKSAIANAIKKAEDSQDRLDADDLFVETAFINEGPRLKRIRPAPMGRAYRYQRRTAHITIELGEKK